MSPYIEAPGHKKPGSFSLPFGQGPRSPGLQAQGLQVLESPKAALCSMPCHVKCHPVTQLPLLPSPSLGNGTIEEVWRRRDWWAGAPLLCSLSFSSSHFFNTSLAMWPLPFQIQGMAGGSSKGKWRWWAVASPPKSAAWTDCQSQAHGGTDLPFGIPAPQGHSVRGFWLFPSTESEINMWNVACEMLVGCVDCIGVPALFSLF